MRSYRRLQRVLAALLVSYVLMAVFIQAAGGAAYRWTFFPISDWSLFSMVLTRMTDYQVRVVELDGQRFDPGRLPEDCRERLPALGTLDAFELIQNLGNAVKRGDEDKEKAVRRALEGIYFEGAGHVRYELVRRSYDPVARWRHGAFEEIQPLRQFDARAER